LTRSVWLVRTTIFSAITAAYGRLAVGNLNIVTLTLPGMVRNTRVPNPTTITEPPFCNWTLLDFSCPFLILPSLRNYRDMGEMSLCLCMKFYLKTFCPLFVVIACRRFWTDLFAILWQRAEPPNSKSDGAIPKQVASRPGETETRTRFARLWSGEWKFLWRQRVLLLRRRRPSSSGNFALISLGTYIWHIGYLIKRYEYNCNKIRDARLCRVPSRSNNTF
jgi:hypothetical protein